MSISVNRPSSTVVNLENILRSQVESSADLCVDTRLLKNGDVFLAYPVGGGNSTSDNRVHIPQALEQGAALVLYEDAAWEEEKYPNVREVLGDERCIAVRGLAEIAGELSSNWYENPSQHLNVIGITGTNGKTTVSHWLAQAFAKIEPTAVIGTLGVGFLGNLHSNGFTTPDAPRVQRTLAELRTQHAKTIAMEVSSHALDQGRVNSVEFKTAIFTNLTQDHLDYHGDMQQYELAKRRLFSWPGLCNAIIHIDDAVGKNWLSDLVRTEGLGVWVYGLDSTFAELPESIQQECKSVLVKNIQSTTQGIRFECSINQQWHTIEMSCIGDFNVKNALAVLSALLAYGVETQKAIRLVESLHAVPGRMEVVNPNDNFHPLMVVDFAHTPDALEKVLQALRPLAQARGGKLVCIFGCGGNRDAGKRPKMGAIASNLADEIVVTSDNPRFEDPELIIDQVISGVSAACQKQVVRHADRASAILSSVKRASEKDVLLVAGKGHETTQEINGKKFPFSDLDHIRLAIGGMQ